MIARDLKDEMNRHLNATTSITSLGLGGKALDEDVGILMESEFDDVGYHTAVAPCKHVIEKVNVSSFDAEKGQLLSDCVFDCVDQPCGSGANRAIKVRSHAAVE